MGGETYLLGRIINDSLGAPFMFLSFLIGFVPFPLMEVVFHGETGKQRLCF
jgi:hypothetical protein